VGVVSNLLEMGSVVLVCSVGSVTVGNIDGNVVIIAICQVDVRVSTAGRFIDGGIDFDVSITQVAVVK